MKKKEPVVIKEINKIRAKKGLKPMVSSDGELFHAPELDQVGVDNDPGIDVPLHLRGGHFKWNFEKTPMSIYDKITLVLTLVNVAILISLVIKNVWMK